MLALPIRDKNCLGRIGKKPKPSLAVYRAAKVEDADLRLRRLRPHHHPLALSGREGGRRSQGGPTKLKPMLEPKWGHGYMEYMTIYSMFR